MTASLFLHVSENIALGLLTLAMALAVVRLVRGPTMADRVLALDLMTTLSISIIAVLAMLTGVGLELDIALALCLVGFVATAALARYILIRRGGSAPISSEEAGGR